ncbi:MAG: hypothetical protein N4A48_09060 [Tepidibacter sp.]|jgi:hypothetical protein|nr:hypothetical protein [Tepidibacter sp.]MCT4508895.1 hypothetical protein [Tepidibacter sp.]
MKISNKLKSVLCSLVFGGAFLLGNTSMSFFCPHGIFEEPTAPKALLKK